MKNKFRCKPDRITDVEICMGNFKRITEEK